MKPSFVVDCSVIMSWLFSDEQNDEADRVLHRLHREAAVVPPLCHLEAANVLLMAERKKRISRSQISQLMMFLGELPLLTDEESLARHTDQILSLGRDYGLTAYDAAYLELAIRLGLPLITLDRRLREAAQSAGLPDLPAIKTEKGRNAGTPAVKKPNRKPAKLQKKR